MPKGRRQQDDKRVVKIDGLTVVLPKDPPPLNPDAARILLDLLLEAASKHQKDTVLSDNVDA